MLKFISMFQSFRMHRLPGGVVKGGKVVVGILQGNIRYLKNRCKNNC